MQVLASLPEASQKKLLPPLLSLVTKHSETDIEIAISGLEEMSRAALLRATLRSSPHGIEHIPKLHILKEELGDEKGTDRLLSDCVFDSRTPEDVKILGALTARIALISSQARNFVHSTLLGEDSFDQSGVENSFA